MSNLPTNIHLRNVRLAPHVMYICPECGRGFRTQNDWRMHLNVKHDYVNKTVQDYDFKRVTERFHECQSCQKWVASEKNTMVMIQYHRFTHLPFPLIYRCLHCRDMFQRRRLLNDHLEIQHAREIKQYEARVRANKLKEQNRQQQQQNYMPPPSARPLVSTLAQHRVQKKLPQQKQQTQTLANQKQQTQPLPQQKQQKVEEKEDLIRKALLNSHIDLDFEDNSSSTQIVEKNPNEEALDRSLIALEEIMRQDMTDNEAEILLSDETLNNNSNNTSSNVQSELKDDTLEDLFGYLLHDDSEASVNMSKPPQEESENKTENLHLEDIDNKINQIDDDINEDDKLISIQIEALDKEEVIQLNQSSPGLLKNSSHNNKRKRSPSSSSNKDQTSKTTKSQSKRVKLSNDEFESELKKELYKHVIYLCPECAKEYSTESGWRKHVFNEHDFANITEKKFSKDKNVSSYECLECFEVLHTKKPSDLLRHYFLHSPYRSYLKCNICSRTKTNTSKIINHIRYNHTDEVQAACKKIGFDIDDHLDDDDVGDGDAEITQSLRCEYCTKVFKYPERFHKHVMDCKRKHVEKEGTNCLEMGYKEMLSHIDGTIARLTLIRANM